MRPARGHGFTLIELLVAMALGAILVGVTSFIFINARRVYDQSLQEIATANELRGAFERLARDLHDVQVSPTDSLGIKTADDATHGPEDVLEYVTLLRTETTATPAKVQVRLGARDGDGLAPLVRSVSGDEQVLLRHVRSFTVEYAWPSQGTDADPAKGTNAGQMFIRGPGAGPWAGPAPGGGERFFYEGSGTIAPDGVLTITSTPYDGTTRTIPRALATTVYARYAPPDHAPIHAFPVLDVTGPTTLELLGTVPGTVQTLWIPLLPSALQVTIDHEGRNGPRSVTEVLKLSR